MITLALSKGRIFEEIMPLLAAAGIEVLEDPEKSRKLILPTNRDDVRVIIVRATDVPTYVQYGGADIGVCGKDTLIEHSAGSGDPWPVDSGADSRSSTCTRPCSAASAGTMVAAVSGLLVTSEQTRLPFPRAASCRASSMPS